MHSWNDDWPYWDDLYVAQDFIKDYVKDNSECHLCCKEKYGSIRYEQVWPKDWENITWEHPEYNTIVAKGWRVLDEAITKAASKWPMMEEELTEDRPEWSTKTDES